MSTLVPMLPGAVNSPETILTSAIDTTATIIEIGTTAKFPDAPFYLVLGGNATNAETVLVTAKAATIVTVERAYQGTAQPWPGGTIAAVTFTEAHYRAMVENITSLDDNKAPATVTLSNIAASNELPATTQSTPAGLLQTIRNCLRWLTERFNADGRATRAVTADALTTARTITVDANATTAASFDGSANVSPGVSVTTAAGVAATTLPPVTATTLQGWLTVARNCLAWLTARFNADGRATRAVTADTLTTARTINGVSFNGSANFTLTPANIGAEPAQTVADQTITANSIPVTTPVGTTVTPSAIQVRRIGNICMVQLGWSRSGPDLQISTGFVLATFPVGLRPARRTNIPFRGTPFSTYTGILTLMPDGRLMFESVPFGANVNGVIFINIADAMYSIL